MGRKTKLTPERQSKIVDLIKRGNYVETACQAVGISQSTFYGWKARGDKSKSGRYLEFLEAIKKAEAEAEALYLSVIQNEANTGTWQASAWYLERRYPNKWGRREKIEHSGRINLEVNWDAADDTD